MDLEILKKIGLSDGEVRIYNVLLNSGKASLNTIHEKSGIERRNIYDILNKLIGKGLVSYITENKKKSFQISNPKNLISYIEEKKSSLDDIGLYLQKVIPDMNILFEETKPRIKAEVYSGFEGVKSIWEDMLNYKESFWIGSGRYVPKRLPNFFASWNRRRIKIRHIWWNICRYEFKNEPPFKLEHDRYLPKDFSGNPTVICIYGNKVVNFIYTEDFFGFVIESKELAENYRSYHKYLWKKVTKPCKPLRYEGKD